MSFEPTNVFALNFHAKTKEINLEDHFKQRQEFKLLILKSFDDISEPLVQWNMVRDIIKDRVDHEFVMICRFDHEFSSEYNPFSFFNDIREANLAGADLLAGGVVCSSFAIPISTRLFFVKKFSGFSFLVIFQRVFSKLLSESFSGHDSIDDFLSAKCRNKFVCFPFISEISSSQVNSDEDGLGNSLLVRSLAEKNRLCFESLLKVREYFRTITTSINHNITIEEIILPVYVINLLKRSDRLNHIRSQFLGRNEFDVLTVEAVEHEIGAVGLWESICKVINIALQNDDDVIVICEDDHEFTASYNKQTFMEEVLSAYATGCDMLIGGIAGGFDHGLFINQSLFWTSSFWSTQFLVLYKKFFKRILEEKFSDFDTADGILSSMTSNKLVIYPFISIQKDFGYSDVTAANNLQNGNISSLFNKAESEIEYIKSIQEHYHGSFL